MDEIVVSVQRVTDIMAEVSSATREQTAGIEQVSQTVVQLDEATQQNAALVEEATAAARSLEDQASELTSAVAQFKLSNHGGVVQRGGREQQPESGPTAVAMKSRTASSNKPILAIVSRTLAAESLIDPGWKSF